MLAFSVHTSELLFELACAISVRPAMINYNKQYVVKL